MLALTIYVFFFLKRYEKKLKAARILSEDKADTSEKTEKPTVLFKPSFKKIDPVDVYWIICLNYLCVCTKFLSKYIQLFSSYITISIVLIIIKYQFHQIVSRILILQILNNLLILMHCKWEYQPWFPEKWINFCRFLFSIRENIW